MTVSMPSLKINWRSVIQYAKRETSNVKRQKSNAKRQQPKVKSQLPDAAE